jgi:hypothetical protein
MRVTKDLLSGLLFAVIGLGVILISSGYPIGSARAMGPGFFPVVLGGLLATIGLFIFARAVLLPESSIPVRNWALRPLLLVVAAILSFCALISAAGLVASVIALVIFSRIAAAEGNLKEVLATALILPAVAVAIFVYALKIPIKLWPW